MEVLIITLLAVGLLTVAWQIAWGYSLILYIMTGSDAMMKRLNRWRGNDPI